jgi:protein required for attachment to host cells
MSYDTDNAVAGCLTRLDKLSEAIDRLQRAHALRVSNPASERARHDVLLAKTAIDTDVQILRIKLSQINNLVACEAPPKMSRRRQTVTKALSN